MVCALLNHYIRTRTHGRVNPRPSGLVSEGGALAALDADNGHGALAAYSAMGEAVRLSRASGTGAIAIRNSSHLEPAGAYASTAVEADMIGLAMCNSDSFVRLRYAARRCAPAAW